MPPPVVYGAGFLAGAVVERAVPTPAIPGPVRVAAGAAGAAALAALDTRAMLLFRRSATPVNPARPASRLVTDGPYRFTRNPMYVGMALAYAGGAVAAQRLWSLATLPLVLRWVDRAVVPREERHLEETFGVEYEAYRGRVPRWLSIG